MINRENIRHSAVLEPKKTKKQKPPKTCDYYEKYHQHAYVKTRAGYEQCIECGKISE